MGLLDRTRAWKGEGVPGQAVVLVNRGAARGPSELTSLVTLTARALPDGPEGTIRSDARNYQAELITHGMHIPVLLDPATGEPKGLMQDHLDEAIGRYYQQQEPAAYATWEEALETRKRAFTRGLFSPLPAVGDVRGAVKDLPGGLRSTFREWRKAAAAFRTESTTRPARVTAIEATAERADGQTVYAMSIEVRDAPPPFRTVHHRQALSDAKAAQLAQSGWTEVTVDPADPERLTL